MDITRRRQILRDFKDHKARPGIFALRCAASGESWVGISADLKQQPNALALTFRMGSHPNPAVQVALRRHGAEALQFEVLEAIEDENLSDYSRKVLLKERQDHWVESLGARKLF